MSNVKPKLIEKKGFAGDISNATFHGTETFYERRARESSQEASSHQKLFDFPDA